MTMITEAAIARLRTSREKFKAENVAQGEIDGRNAATDELEYEELLKVAAMSNEGVSDGATIAERLGYHDPAILFGEDFEALPDVYFDAWLVAASEILDEFEASSKDASANV